MTQASRGWLVAKSGQGKERKEQVLAAVLFLRAAAPTRQVSLLCFFFPSQSRDQVTREKALMFQSFFFF